MGVGLIDFDAEDSILLYAVNEPNTHIVRNIILNVIEWYVFFSVQSNISVSSLRKNLY